MIKYAQDKLYTKENADIIVEQLRTSERDGWWFIPLLRSFDGPKTDRQWSVAVFDSEERFVGYW